MADVQAIEALYYPGPELPSAAWLKAALLYWEGLLRIVPDGETPQDPTDVKALVEAGVVQNLSPAPFLRTTAETFGTRLEDLLQSRKGQPLDDHRSSTGGTRDGEERVHLTQIEQSLVSELESKRLLSIDGQWAHMSPTVARLYHITLANEAARQLFAAPVTEDNGCNVAATYLSARKVTSDPQGVPTDGWQWAELYTPFPSIDSVRALSVKKLLNLRTKNAHLRQRFREAVQRGTAAIATLPSAEAIRTHLEDMAKEMERELEDQRDALRAARIHNVWTLLSLSSPMSIGTGLSLAAGAMPAAAVGAFGTVGLGIVNWFFERKAEKREGGHYLLALCPDVDRAKMTADFSDRMHRIIHGGRPDGS
jgi:hypothetical protein